MEHKPRSFQTIASLSLSHPPRCEDEVEYLFGGGGSSGQAALSSMIEMAAIKSRVGELAMTGGLWNSTIRSLCWKFLLGLISENINNWVLDISIKRKEYRELVHRYYYSQYKNEKEINANNELNDEEVDKSQVTMNLIQKDVLRTRQESALFQKEEIQQVLTRILFVWSMIHVDIGYRQGINEIAAIILQVLNDDATTVLSNGTSSSILKALMSRENLEADCYCILDALMTKHMSKYYKASSTAGEDGLILELQLVSQVFLPILDVELHDLLFELRVTPEMYLVRWIRVLFSREVSYLETLLIWDALLAVGGNADSVTSPRASSPTPMEIYGYDHFSLFLGAVCAQLLCLFREKLFLNCEDSAMLVGELKKNLGLKEDQIIRLLYQSRRFTRDFMNQRKRSLKKSLLSPPPGSVVTQVNYVRLHNTIIASNDENLSPATEKAFDSNKKSDDGYLRL